MRRIFLLLFTLSLLAEGCALFQSMVKSSFPYTATLTVPRSDTGKEYAVTATASSFDENFSHNMAARTTLVRVISARLMAIDPGAYNIGNFSSVRIYLSGPHGGDDLLVAYRNVIPATAGNVVTLDVDNSQFLDALVRAPEIQVRMAYRLRQDIGRQISLHLVLGIAAYPKTADK